MIIDCPGSVPAQPVTEHLWNVPLGMRRALWPIVSDEYWKWNFNLMIRLTSNLLVLMVHSKQHFLSQSWPQKQRLKKKVWWWKTDDCLVYVPTSIPASDLEFSPSSHLLSRQNKWLVWSGLVWMSVCPELSVTQTHCLDNTSHSVSQ